MTSRKRGRHAPGPARDTVRLEVLVEEESAARALRPLLGSLLHGQRVRVDVRTFQGKPDLLKKLPDRLAGYARARRHGADIRVAVLVDRDSDACTELKQDLDRTARRAGLVPRADSTPGARFTVLNRIAVRELESWYFGDWAAVRAAFPSVPARPPKAYRAQPDAAAGKCSDTFQKVLRDSGVRVVSKPQWGERVGAHLSLTGNTSASFRAFVSGIRELVAT